MKPAALAAVTSLVLLGLGCKSPSQMITEKAVEGYVNSNINGQVDIDGGTVKFNNDDVTAAYGEGATLPNDFPKDVPVYKGATLLMASVSKKDNAASLMATSTDSFEKVSAWYVAELKSENWLMVSEQDVSGATYRQYAKDARELVVSVSGDGEGTTITLSVNAK